MHQTKWSSGRPLLFMYYGTLAPSRTSKASWKNGLFCDAMFILSIKEYNQLPKWETKCNNGRFNWDYHINRMFYN